MASQSNSRDYKKVLESALFVSGRAMELEEMAKIAGIGSIGHAKKLLAELIKDYDTRDTALKISEIGGKYSLGVKNEYAEMVGSLAGAPEISKSSLRILAYVSKNEPVMQNSIVKAFGSSTYEHIKELQEKEFIRAMRAGRTKRIETTEKFREYFGLQ
ncbi:MAG: SMC-Scp complex subunit ScpB [Candidatus Micrarchaeaceae archaeon]|nr:SMC-Scp complex subunit ScpB [Candidatus Micrarchaeota archaeon]HII09939.1 SMC-Scp complex subunit ScpB [Candidatus Micrarchaeota archaeon]